MASLAPLFWPDLDSVAEQLRMKDVDTNDQAYRQFEEALRRTATDFWRRIGLARVVQLQAMPTAVNPTTENEHIRQLANSLEVRRVRRHLLEVYAASFKQGASFISSWNEEAFRNLDAFGAKKEIERLDAEAESDFQLLEGSNSPGNEISGAVSVITSEDFDANGPRLIGDSVIPGGVFGGLQ